MAILSFRYQDALDRTQARNDIKNQNDAVYQARNDEADRTMNFGDFAQRALQSGGDFGQAVIDRVGGAALRGATRLGATVVDPFVEGNQKEQVEGFIKKNMENQDTKDIDVTGDLGKESHSQAALNALNYSSKSVGGKTGKIVGTGANVIAQMVALAEAGRFGGGLGGTSSTFNAAEGAGSVATHPILSFLGSSVAGSATADLMTRGSGQKANILEDVATGIGADLLFKGAGKAGKYVFGKIAGRGVEEGAEALTRDVLKGGEVDDIVNPTKIPVRDESAPAAIGKVTSSLPDAPLTRPSAAGYSDGDFRAMFNKTAKDVAKLPAAAEAYTKTGGSHDATTLAVQAIADTKSTKKLNVMVDKLLPDLTVEDRNVLVKGLKNIDTPAETADLLYDIGRVSQPTKDLKVTPLDKHIGFPDAATEDVPGIGMTPPDQAKAALTGDKTTWMNEDAGLGNDSLEAKLTPAAKGVTEQADDIQLSPGSVDDAKASVAGVNAPTKEGVSAATEALSGGEKQLVDNSKSNVEKGAQNIFEHLNEQAKTYDKTLEAPESVAKHLVNNDAVATASRKNSWLDHYEDTLSVLGRHFGSVGTDVGYKLAQGAKVVSDIQEKFRPDVDAVTKFTKKLSSNAAKKAVGDRMEKALNDRANAGKYLQGDKEKEIFEKMAAAFDWFKDKRVSLGKNVISDDYSPRAMIKDAVDAPDRLLGNLTKGNAAIKDVTDAFSKSRKLEEDTSNANVLDLFARYVSGQAKEFGYEDAVNYAKDNIGKVDKAYLSDSKGARQGAEYLGTLFNQVLNPKEVSKFERLQNSLIAQTYKAALKFSPKFAMTNSTQAYATKIQISKEASKLVSKIDKGLFKDLQEGLTSGDNPITGEIEDTIKSTIGKSSKGVLNKASGVLEKADDIMSKFSELDPGTKSEKRNVEGAFNRGITQQLLETDSYKAAVKAGKSETEAAKEALSDPATRDLAIRRGNIIVNDTQFGANFVTKPEAFRETGTILGVSKKWFNQYKRFPVGMTQNLTTMFRGDDARMLDILKRGNPAETPIVDYLKAAKALQNGAKDVLEGVKDGSIHDVSLEVAQGYHDTMKKAVGQLNSEIKAHSQIRAGKTAKNFGKMWAAASAIQFLFDGGLSMSGDDQKDEVGKSLKYGAPVNPPSNRDLSGLIAASSPYSNGHLNKRKLLNFVPVVGPVVNRGADVKKFYDALTGN